MPNELPFFAESVEKLQIACIGQRLVADRVDENVPVFRETIQIPGSASKAVQSVVSNNPQALAAEDHGTVVPAEVH